MKHVKALKEGLNKNLLTKLINSTYGLGWFENVYNMGGAMAPTRPRLPS